MYAVLYIIYLKNQVQFIMHKINDHDKLTNDSVNVSQYE